MAHRIPIAAVLAVVMAGYAIEPVLACTGPVPSFRDSLTNASLVVIGDVIAVANGGVTEPSSHGRSSRFTLRVRYAPHGNAPGTVEITDRRMDACGSVIDVRKGDRIAIAFEATVVGIPATRIDTFAWIRGTPTSEGFETITTAEVFRLLGLEPPDTSTAMDRPDGGIPVGLLLSLLAGAFAFAAVAFRAGARFPAGPSPDTSDDPCGSAGIPARFVLGQQGVARTPAGLESGSKGARQRRF